MHHKQHHTARRVFDRLREEHGFTGGYTIIKDYIRERERERRGREMFVPLAHPPGHAQADFGEATVVIARHCPRTNGGQWLGVEQKADFFVMDLPNSDSCFVRAYRAAPAEACPLGDAGIACRVTDGRPRSCLCLLRQGAAVGAL